MMHSKEKSTPIPGVLATVAAGFDTTAKHFWLILIPVLLDSFFWIGPRLSFRLLVERLAAYWQQQVVVAGVDLDVLLELAPRTNLFTSLSIPILGVPALMAGITPEKTPMPVKTWELESGWLWMVLFVGLSLVGLSLSAVYLELTAYVIRKQRDESTPLNVYAFLRQTGLVWLKLLGMAITFIVSAFLIICH